MILSDFRVILPHYQSTQEQTIDWLSKAHEVSNSGLSKVVSRYVCKPSRVARRYHALEDFTHTDWDRMKIFNLPKNRGGAGSQDRMKFFSEVAWNTFCQFYIEDTEAPEEIIHVTCTGYVSPSAAQRVVSQKNWGEKTEVVHAYHMGCYAAIPAIKLASGPKDRIDIVHTELCSLHFNPSIQKVEQLVVQGLFSDGLIRYSAFSEPSFQKHQKSGLEVISTHEEIIPETSDEMIWEISDSSMLMTLSRDISKHIGNHLPKFLERLCGDSVKEMMESAIFAIHPGGPLIIDDTSKILSLRNDQVRFSEKILRERGNMSSATLPHIWKEILDDTNIPSGQMILSLAFGPGLTVAGAILKKHA